MKILGAGISGLIAAHVFQNAEVVERSTREEMVGHKALLRFRSTAVAEAVGIDFKKVRVHKGLWCDGKFVQPSILHANLYSQKVLNGAIADRSIWSMEPVDRYIAPENFVEQMIERVGNRIVWGCSFEENDLYNSKRSGNLVISTIPLQVMVKLSGMGLELSAKGVKFPRAAIQVRRWRIPNCDVHQTVYVSDPFTNCYRVSITGDMLIAEYIALPDGAALSTANFSFDAFEPFGIKRHKAEKLGEVEQQYGKIQPIDDRLRKRLIFELSQKHNVFSLGRFGTWRNILLDDVVHDCSVIKRLINQTGYERSQHSAK